jgi:hypothetical protein
MRVLYPKTVFGGISSSGVTEAIIDYWQYLDTIRRALDKTCSSNVVGSTFDVDWYLDQGAAGELKIKTLFGLEGLSNAADFGSTIGWYSYGGWQGRNWDPAIGDTSVDDFCAALNLPPNSQKELGNLPYGDPKRKVQVTVGNVTETIDFALANFAKFSRDVSTSLFFSLSRILTRCSLRLL